MSKHDESKDPKPAAVSETPVKAKVPTHHTEKGGATALGPGTPKE